MKRRDGDHRLNEENE